MEMADLAVPAGVTAAAGEIDKHQQDLLGKKKRRAGAASADQQPSPADACFDCNICLDFAADPVVTLCGHLYCWPCIYKWLRLDCAQDDLAESDLDGPSSAPRQQQCPVCKAALSESALVPLYGRGICDKDGEASTALAVPRRPLPSGLPIRQDAVTLQPRVGAPGPSRQAGRDYVSGFMSSTVVHPLFHGVAMLPFLLTGSGSGTSSEMFYPELYYGAGRGVAERRQEMQSARSLQRVSVFLFLCIVLCLLLF